MAKPLDGVALPAYFRRLGYEHATQDLLIHNLTSLSTKFDTPTRDAGCLAQGSA